MVQNVCRYVSSMSVMFLLTFQADISGVSMFFMEILEMSAFFALLFSRNLTLFCLFQFFKGTKNTGQEASITNRGSR